MCIPLLLTEWILVLEHDYWFALVSDTSTNSSKNLKDGVILQELHLIRYSSFKEVFSRVNHLSESFNY